MIQEFEKVVFTVDLPEYHLVAGDVGTVVDIYHNGEACHVEVFYLDGHTFAVVGVETSQVRPVSALDLVHVRTQPELPE